MKIKLSILILFISLTGLTQTSYDHPFQKRKPGIMRFYTGISAPKENTPDKFDRFNTDFFWNSWLGEQNGVTTKFYAIGHNINLMFDIPFSKNSIFGIAIGFGYSHFNVRNDGHFSYVDNLSVSGQHTQLDKYTGEKRVRKLAYVIDDLIEFVKILNQRVTQPINYFLVIFTIFL